MVRGKNLAHSNGPYGNIFESASEKAPCIFLSHKREDKDGVLKIGDYIRDVGINIYLDIYDPELQIASNDDDHNEITRLLEEGINRSTHMLCFLSERTRESWWVPYELGYGKKSENYLSTLLLKDFNGKENVPSYLLVGGLIKGADQLNEYLENIIQEKVGLLYRLKEEKLTISKDSAAYPLRYYMDLGY